MPKNQPKKSAQKPKTAARRAPRRRGRTPRLAAALPEVLRTERVLSVAKNIEETRAAKEVEKALRGAGDALQSFADRLTSLEVLAEERIESLRLRVVDALPFEGASLDTLSTDLSDRALKELDDVLLRLGLVRISVVEAEKKALERKLRALKKDLKTAKASAVVE